MESVNIVNEYILKKINLLNIITKILQEDNINEHINELIVIKETYLMGSLQLIASYNDSPDDEKTQIYEDYSLLIGSENYIETLDNIANDLFKYDNPKINPYIHDYRQMHTNQVNHKEVSIMCDQCNIEYITRPENSDRYCPSCGIIEALKGTHFDSSDIIKSKPYKPSKHGERWVMRIFASEKTPIPDMLITDILKLMKRDQVGISQLTCKLLRDIYLKELQYTKYNPNIPKIRRIITGLSPPQPTRAEYDKICRMFDLIDNIFIKIKPEKYTSRRYYPHFIRKIIEHVYNSRPTVKNAIIENIHCQEVGTTESHDKLWQSICTASDGKLKFTKTQELIYYSK